MKIPDNSHFIRISRWLTVVTTTATKKKWISCVTKNKSFFVCHLFTLLRMHGWNVYKKSEKVKREKKNRFLAGNDDFPRLTYASRLLPADLNKFSDFCCAELKISPRKLVECHYTLARNLLESESLSELNLKLPQLDCFSAICEIWQVGNVDSSWPRASLGYDFFLCVACLPHTRAARDLKVHSLLPSRESHSPADCLLPSLPSSPYLSEHGMGRVRYQQQQQHRSHAVLIFFAAAAVDSYSLTNFFPLSHRKKKFMLQHKTTPVLSLVEAEKKNQKLCSRREFFSPLLRHNSSARTTTKSSTLHIFIYSASSTLREKESRRAPKKKPIIFIQAKLLYNIRALEQQHDQTEFFFFWGPNTFFLSIQKTRV